MSQTFRPRSRYYDAEWVWCDRCDGTGENIECYDDLCHAHGRCMHGDNTCALCGGVGHVTEELDRRFYNRDAFESVEIPDADLYERRQLHEAARERHGRKVER